MTIIYPDNQDQAQYIADVTRVYSMNSTYKKQIEAFSAEIIVKTANIIDNSRCKATTIGYLQSLLDGTSESDQSELGSIFSQASLNDDEEIMSPSSEVELFLKGDKDIITINIANKDISLELEQKLEELQQIVADMTRKCIKEICAVNLSLQQIQRPENPTLAPFPQGAAPQPLSDRNQYL